MSVVDQPQHDPPTSAVVTPGAAVSAPGGRFAVFSLAAFRYLWLNTFAFALVQSTQRFTYVWLVVELGGREGASGVVSFFLGAPVLFLSLPAGALSDRIDRRTLLLASQIGALAVSLATAGLIAWDVMTIPLAYLLAAAAGTTLSVGQPVRQAIVPSVVPPDRLMNAIALMSLGMNVSLVAGPALGGGVIAVAGLSGAFLAQAGVYAVALLTLLPLRVPAVAATARRRMAVDIREGLSFVWRHRGIRTLIGLLAASGIFMLAPFFALLPVIASEKLEQDAFGASMILSAIGVGMFLTSLLLAGWRHMRGKGRVFTVNLIAGGAFLAGIGLSSSYPLTLALAFAWGLGGGIFVNLNQTLIQANTPPNLMGRVMSVHMLAFMGLMPVGSLLAGGVGEAIGASAWVVIAGATVAALALIAVFTTPSLRGMD